MNQGIVVFEPGEFDLKLEIRMQAMPGSPYDWKNGKKSINKNGNYEKEKDLPESGFKDRCTRQRDNLNSLEMTLSKRYYILEAIETKTLSAKALIPPQKARY
jgi:hypothetical protein